MRAKTIYGNFKRGLDPKDAMGIGDSYERFKQIIRKALERLFVELKLRNKKIEVTEDKTGPGEYVRFWFRNGARYYITYQADFDGNQWFEAGWEIGAKGNYDGDEVTCNSIEEAIEYLKNWIQ